MHKHGQAVVDARSNLNTNGIKNGKGESMIKAEFEMDMPRECHECPFQLKFKGEDVDDWYTRRCVLINKRIEYPRPDWCPLQPVKEDEQP